MRPGRKAPFRTCHLLRFEEGSGQLRLPDYGEKCSGAELGMLRNRHGDRRIGELLLHYRMASTAPDLRETVSREDLADLRSREDS